VYMKIKDTKNFQTMQQECVQSHCHWVDVNPEDSLRYLNAARRKANAWLAVLKKLNNGYRLSFDIPIGL